MLALPILFMENKCSIIRAGERLDLVNCISILAEFRFLSWKSVHNKTVCLITPGPAALSEKKQILQSKTSSAVTFPVHCP